MALAAAVAAHSHPVPWAWIILGVFGFTVMIASWGGRPRRRK